jgi:hypothetical protein
VKYRDSLPLFRGYVPPVTGSSSSTGYDPSILAAMTVAVDPAGYRWRVLFWRNL